MNRSAEVRAVDHEHVGQQPDFGESPLGYNRAGAIIRTEKDKSQSQSQLPNEVPSMYPSIIANLLCRGRFLSSEFASDTNDDLNKFVNVAFRRAKINETGAQ